MKIKPGSSRSLRLGHKLILVIVFVVALSSMATTVLFFMYGQDVVRESIWTDMKKLLLNKDEQLLSHVTRRDYWSLFRIVQGLSSSHIVDSAWIMDKDGYMLAHSDPGTYPVLSKSTEALHADISHQISGVSGSLGTLYMEVNGAAIASSLAPLKKLVYLGNFLVLTISVGFACFFSRHITRRFNRIFHEVQKAARGHPGDVDEVRFSEKDEIQTLASELRHAFHGLADSLENTRFAQEFYNSVLSTVPDIVLVVEADGTIIYANAQHEQLGYQLHQLLGIRWQSLFKQTPTLQPHGDTSSGWLTGEGVILVNGRKFPALITLSTLSSYDIVAIQNIETVKALERQIHYANTFSALGKLSANFAHEIKNTISPIRLLYRINHHTEQDIAIMEQSIKQVDALVTKYLNFARTDAAISDFSVRMDRIAMELLALHDCQVQEKQLTIKTQLEPAPLYYNEEALRSIIKNLLLNAIDASPHGACIWLTLHTRDEQVVLTMADMGEGISDDDKERIFEPFFTTKPSGSGIGLATVNHHVQSMSGHMIVRNRPDGGAFFTVILPKNRQHTFNTEKLQPLPES
ncbi:sensor histidine kinase [Thiohalomonas denitrificans]|uniref:sensor histidine kinase n=1 Tax=Thiohalomonas denitrificans TaxID=415747 RepID=UPI0026E94609|nr:ATP-binding protein [Thiohalomonas denitrificans]